MANFVIPEHPVFNLELQKFRNDTPAYFERFNVVFQQFLNNEAYLFQEIKKAGGNNIKIGPADTPLNTGDTLFVVDEIEEETFKAAAFNNVIFSTDPPTNGEYWAGTEAPQSRINEAVSITNGKLAVSEEQNAPNDAAFLAKINL